MPEFADGYAQSVTFALLLARTEGIEFAGKTVDGITHALGKTHSLLGKALAVLTSRGSPTRSPSAPKDLRPLTPAISRVQIRACVPGDARRGRWAAATPLR